MSDLQVGDVITTAEEAEELVLLPAWSGVVDAGGHSWVKFPGYDAWVCAEGDLLPPVVIFECDKPLTVASLPSRPERVVKAEALREAASLLYADDGPRNPLSTATWLRQRAEDLEAGETR